MKKTKTTKTRKPKKTGRKQTSPDISTLAAEMVAALRGVRGSRVVGHYYPRGVGSLDPIGTVKQLRSCLMSLIGQDETPRQKRERRVRK